MSGIFGAITDGQFWKDTGNNWLSYYKDPIKSGSKLYSDMSNYGKKLQELPGKASDIADATFPNEKRDNSRKNAFRHALGTGMLAQEWGGGLAGATAAKGVGYLWEAPTWLAGKERLGERVDSRHDLNANAVGATVAQRTANNAELIAALQKMAVQSSRQLPPGGFERSAQRLTHTE